MIQSHNFNFKVFILGQIEALTLMCNLSTKLISLSPYYSTPKHCNVAILLLFYKIIL